MRRRENKKAMWALVTFGKYILALAALIVIVAFMAELFGGVQGQSAEQSCRTSIVARGSFKFGVFNEKETASLFKVENVYPIQCKTKDVIVPVEKPSKIASPEEIKEQVMDDVADLMAKCWWMFANGQYHDILGDTGSSKDLNLCHVCYSFSIRPDIGSFQPITMEEFTKFIGTNPYRPGLLQGGNAIVGGIGEYEFTPQEAFESARETRRMSEERLLSSPTVIKGGVADFAGLFTNRPTELARLKRILNEMAVKHGLNVVFITVNGLPEETFKGDTSLGYRIIEEWNLDPYGKDNTVVFLFSLNNGILHYATQFASDAVFPDYLLQQLFAQSVGPFMGVKEPLKAVVGDNSDLGLAEAMLNHLQQQETNTQDTLLFQRSYAAYITGGKQGATAVAAPNKLLAQGAFLYPPDFAQIEQGKVYAIAYFNVQWHGQYFIWSWSNERQLSNAIMLTPYESLLTSGAPCDVNAENT